jgi:catechol 2,3-dioxygenase-like lactoylglutathione lyase family enzyme
MSEETIIQHVAVECSRIKTADLFFSTILGMPKVKTATLLKELSASIFGIDSTIDMVIYENATSRFEVFIRSTEKKISVDHVGIKVSDRNDFVDRCKKHGLKPFYVQKDSRQLLFVRDFSGNLFEIT